MSKLEKWRIKTKINIAQIKSASIDRNKMIIRKEASM